VTFDDTGKNLTCPRGVSRIIEMAPLDLLFEEKGKKVISKISSSLGSATSVWTWNASIFPEVDLDKKKIVCLSLQFHPQNFFYLIRLWKNF